VPLRSALTFLFSRPVIPEPQLERAGSRSSHPSPRIRSLVVPRGSRPICDCPLARFSLSLPLSLSLSSCLYLTLPFFRLDRADERPLRRESARGGDGGRTRIKVRHSPPPRNAVMPASLAEMSKWPRCQRTDGPATLKSQLPRTLRSRRLRDPESLPLPREGWRREGNGRDKVADATATTRRRSTRKQLPGPPLRGRRGDRIASSRSPEKDSPRSPLPPEYPLRGS